MNSDAQVLLKHSARRGRCCHDRVNRKTSSCQRQSVAEAARGKMAAAAVAEFQRAQSLLGTDRNASIDILHSIGKYYPRDMAFERKSFSTQTPKLHTSLLINVSL